MAENYETCIERAELAAKAARDAKLDNVRDRELRAEKTWLGLADKARGVAEQREKVEREKRVERLAAANANEASDSDAA
ncbi:MAG: hypothetical protein WBA68_06275 [Alteraurantiacibacter sp.]